MEQITTQFFSNLCTKGPSVNPTLAIDMFEQVLSDQMNEDLCKPFTEQEIGDALFQISPLKAPRPDGFRAHFFQINWAVIKDEVICAMRNFF